MTWETVPFDEAFTDVTSASPRIKQSEFAATGLFPVRDQGEEDVAGYWSDESFATRVTRPLILFGDHTRRVKYAEQDFVVGADGVKVLEPAPSLDPRFAFHWMCSVRVPSAGYSRHFKFLKYYRVPLPPLPEQRRIAAILDEADAVRQKATDFRRHALEELAATFVIEAVSASSTRAPLSRLGVSLSAGLSVGDGGLDSHPDHRILKVSAVSRGAFDATETKSMPMDYKPPTAHLVRSGDLLMTRASGSLDLIARSAFVTQIHDYVYLPDKVWRVEVSPESPLSKRFIDGLTRHPAFRSYVENKASGASGVRNISQAKVLSYEAPVPPTASLTALDGQLVMVEEMRESLAARAKTLDELFASLQYRAFRGEL